MPLDRNSLHGNPLDGIVVGLKQLTQHISATAAHSLPLQLDVTFTFHHDDSVHYRDIDKRHQIRQYKTERHRPRWIVAGGKQLGHADAVGAVISVFGEERNDTCTTKVIAKTQ